MADGGIRHEGGTVLPGGLLVVDIHTFVVLDEVRALKQGNGECHIVLTGGAEVATQAWCAADLAPVLASALESREIRMEIRRDG